ncbi:MAG: ATP-binding protein [Eggerthellaceae bacterium]|nr:ATP-binding protein [Eggerthellaceae bacterium]
MKLDIETRRKLRDMGAKDLLEAFDGQDDSLCIGMTTAERIQIAVDEAYSAYISQKINGLTRRAHLRFPDADVRKLDCIQERKLDRLAIAELASCGWAERGENIVFQGFTGSGKTYLACALAKEACKRLMRSYYIRVPNLEQEWLAAKERPGADARLIQKYGGFQVLVLDEWLFDKPDAKFRSMLFELMEVRYGAKSTVFCTQYRQKDWHARLGGGAHADAIMDRIVHNAVWIDSGEVNMRAKLGKGNGE